MRGGIWSGARSGTLGRAISGALAAGLLIGLPVRAAANVAPDPAACLAQLPAASQAFFQGCSCSGTTLLIDFPAGGEARANDPLCVPTTSTSTADDTTSAGSQQDTGGQTATDQQQDTGGETATDQQNGSEQTQGEADYSITQQTRGSGVDDWLDGVDPISGPYWITSQTGRYNNRSAPNQRTNARLAEIARELDGLRAERAALQRQLERNNSLLEDAQAQRGGEANPFALIFGGLAGQSTMASQASIQSLLQTGQQLLGRIVGLDEQIEALKAEQDELETSVPGPFQSPVGGNFAAADTRPDWAFSHGAAESPWRHFSGRVSLSDIRRHMAHRRYLLAQTTDGRPVADQFLIPDLAVDRRFNAWIAGSYTWSEDGRFGAEGDGGTGQVTAGASYAVSEIVTLGAQLRYRHMDSTRNDGTASSEADGFGGSIFAQVLLPFGAIVTPIIAYERTSTDLTQIIGGAPLTGDFDTDIWTLGAQAAQRFDVHSDRPGRIVWIEPQASLSYVTADRAGWVRSDGVAVPSATIETGTLGFGGKIGAEFLAPSEGITVAEPYFGINGVWAFERPADQLVTSGVLIGAPELFAALSAGVNTAFDGGATLAADVTFSGLGSDVRSWTVGGRLTVPFGG